MSGFIEGENRHQSTLFPEHVDDYVAEDSPVRVIDVFINDLDISGLGPNQRASMALESGIHYWRAKPMKRAFNLVGAKTLIRVI